MKGRSDPPQQPQRTSTNAVIRFLRPAQCVVQTTQCCWMNRTLARRVFPGCCGLAGSYEVMLASKAEH